MKSRLIYLIVVLVAISIPDLPPSVTYAKGETLQAGPNFIGTPESTPLCVNAAIPFVWVRTSPSSSARSLVTLYPKDYARLTKANGSSDVHDNTQWWVKTYITLTSRRLVQGWIEAASLHVCNETVVPAGAPQPPSWGEAALCLRPGVSFLWHRYAPSSYAPVQYTTYARNPCFNGSMPEMVSRNIFRWDGTQWWVLVGHNPRPSSSLNWIETKSVRPAS